MVHLTETNPARRTRCDHREDAPRPKTVQQFVCFLTDRQIGGEVCVEYIIKPYMAERCRHFAGDRRADRISKFFAERGANSRSRLHDNNFIGVIQSIPDIVNMATFVQSCHRAGLNTLTAVNAVDVAHAVAERRSDFRVKPTVCECEYTQSLHLVTCANTTPTKDALACVTHNRWRKGVNRNDTFCAFEADAADSAFLAKGLQFTGAVSHAGRAVHIVVGEDQLQIDPDGIADGSCVGADVHAFFNF